MAEPCGVEHPDRPGVFCDKPKPCLIFHWSEAAQTPWRGPPLTDEHSRRSEVDAMAGHIPPPRTTGPPTIDSPGVKMHQHPRPTEVQAALHVLPKTGTQRRRVYDALVVAGARGLTDEELQQSLRMRSSSERPRRGELVDGGFVVDSGQRRTGSSGEGFIVWVLAQSQTQSPAQDWD